MSRKKATKVSAPGPLYRVPADPKAKRAKTRGRPPKETAGPVLFPVVPFERLPDEPIENPEAVSRMLRDYVRRCPHLEHGAAELAAWLSAAADALDVGDAARVGWYCYNALRAHYAAAMAERIPVPGFTGDTRLRVLANVGAKKLQADAKRGHRGRW